jgi:hypothetical protein
MKLPERMKELHTRKEALKSPVLSLRKPEKRGKEFRSLASQGQKRVVSESASSALT